jgi:hypothetical protein
MKSITTIIFFCFLSIAIHAQITLEKTYNYSTAVVKFETYGYKYYLMDVLNGQCRIYNPDHSLFRTINCNVPNGFFLYDIKFLSENLFDNDAGIELLCTFYKYYSSTQYYEYDSKIINEDGSQIAFIDGALYNYINQTGENEYKLFSYCYDFSLFPEKIWTNIYRLSQTNVSSLYINNPGGDLKADAFPNPAVYSLRVEYTLPSGEQDGILFLYDSRGRAVDEFHVDGHTDHLLLNVSGYSKGVYHYFVKSGNQKSISQKLIVQ